MKGKGPGGVTTGSAGTPQHRGSANQMSANSVVRKSKLEPYHDIASALFNLEKGQELDKQFLEAARVSLKNFMKIGHLKLMLNVKMLIWH